MKRRREDREARDSRQARTIPTHESALFHGAMLEVAQRDAELARLRDRVVELEREVTQLNAEVVQALAIVDACS